MAYIDRITQRVVERRDELRRQDAQLAAQEEGVQRKREQIAAELSKLDIAVEVYSSFDPEPEQNEEQSVAPLPVHSNGKEPDLAGLKIADAAAVVLRSRGGKARAKDILLPLQAAQRIASGPSSYSTLFKTLSRDAGRFEKLGRGLWRLREEPMDSA